MVMIKSQLKMGRRTEPYDRENRGGPRKLRRPYLRRERQENKEAVLTELERLEQEYKEQEEEWFAEEFGDW